MDSENDNPVFTTSAFITGGNTVTIFNNVFECPTHGLTENYIQSSIPGREGYWCQLCWLEALDRMGVCRMKPAGKRAAVTQDMRKEGAEG